MKLCIEQLRLADGVDRMGGSLYQLKGGGNWKMPGRSLLSIVRQLVAYKRRRLQSSSRQCARAPQSDQVTEFYFSCLPSSSLRCNCNSAEFIPLNSNSLRSFHLPLGGLPFSFQKFVSIRLRSYRPWLAYWSLWPSSPPPVCQIIHLSCTLFMSCFFSCYIDKPVANRFLRSFG